MASFTETSQSEQTARIPKRRGGMSLSTGRLIGRILSYTLLLFGAAVMIFPLVWMALASFKPEWQILTTPPIWIPSTWEQVQAGNTAKEFPLWYARVDDDEQVKVFEIGTRRYTSIVDVTQIPNLVSVPADELTTATPQTYGDVTLNARAWQAEGSTQEVVALARDGDNLVVAPVQTLLDYAERRPLDEVNAGSRVRSEIQGYMFLGREAPDGEGVLIQIGPEWQLVIVVPVAAARDAFLVNEDAPIDPQFVQVGETELELYSLQDRDTDERYVLLSVEAWQPIIDLDELETAHLTVSSEQLTGDAEIRRFGAVTMPVDTVTKEDDSTQEVIILQQQASRSLVIPVEAASTLRLAPVSRRLGEPFVRNVERMPVRYIDNYEDEDGQKSVALVGDRETKALVAPQSIITQAFDVQQNSLERVLHIRFRYENYVEALSKNLGGANFVTFFKNSTIVVALNLVGHYISVILVAYAFARLRAPGKNFLFMILLSTMMLPFPVLLIPTYEIFQTFGMLNTLWPLFIRAFFGNAFLIFLLRQFFMSIPRELEEAAIIDGANTLQVLWHVMLPLSKPALATIGIFTFWWHWNAFFEPFVYVNSVKHFTVSLGLAFFKGQYVYNFHWLMAAGMVAIIPVIAIFFFAQRYFIEGIQLTGLKG